MTAYDHDAFLAATRLVTAFCEHGRDSNEYQSTLRGVLAEYELPGVIVALSDIACSWPPDLMVPFAAWLGQAGTEFHDRYMTGEFG